MKTIEMPSDCEQRLDVPTNDTDMLGGFVIFYQPSEYSMTFFVVRVLALGENNAAYFETDTQDFDCEDPDRATPFLAGWMKWDGCSDMDIGGNDISYRNHFCGKESAQIIGKMIDAVYDLAAKTIPNWDEELGA